MNNSLKTRIYVSIGTPEELLKLLGLIVNLAFMAKVPHAMDIICTQKKNGAHTIYDFVAGCIRGGKLKTVTNDLLNNVLEIYQPYGYTKSVVVKKDNEFYIDMPLILREKDFITSDSIELCNYSRGRLKMRNEIRYIAKLRNINMQLIEDFFNFVQKRID